MSASDALQKSDARRQANGARKDADTIVIGSGPAGVSAASALLDRGQRVLVLDVGEEMESERAALGARLGSAEPENWAAEDVSALVAPTYSKHTDSMRPFGSDFLFRDPVDLFGPTGPPNNIELRPSFATGGLSNGWGASVLPYRIEDLSNWPTESRQLARHYEAVRDFMPVAAHPDGLADLFPMLGISEDSALPLSTQANRLLAQLSSQRDALKTLGLHFGRARVAASNDGCRTCRMCLTGCPYGLIYRAGQTLETLCQNERMTYHRGAYVTRFIEESDGVRVRGHDPKTGAPFEFRADRLMIGCGVLPTAQLVLRSLDRIDEPIALKDSQHFYLPMLHSWWPNPNPANEALHTLTQLFVELIDPDIDAHTVHFQLYSHNDFYEADLRKRFGALASVFSPLVRHLSQRLIVAQGFLHSDVSPEMSLRVREVASRGSNDKRTALKVDWKPHPETQAVVARARRRMARGMLKASMLALTPFSRLGAVGSSFHCGSSFPMRERPSGLESDVLGRPAGLRRVHVIDASVFPDIPATTITFSVMANAHRIATAATDPNATNQ